VTPLHVFLETNMGGDKKPSHAFQFLGTGKSCSLKPHYLAMSYAASCG
jgi:hypothetical protein